MVSMPDVAAPADRDGATRELVYWKAVNEALQQELRRDPTMFVMGEDVAGAAGREDQGLVDAWGGPFGITRGLIQEFGPERIRDTPISEAAFIGAAVGAAKAGLRPWVDLMFTTFTGVAWDQISNKLAREYYYTNGQSTLPVTIKTFGVNYAPFIHMPGLKCVAPSNPYNAKGLMIAAIRDDNPVVVFDNLLLLRDKMHVPEEPYTVPIGKSNISRSGTDVTVIGISAMTNVALEAAALLEREGVSVEVIDLLSLEPLDIETLATSVRKTQRAVIVDQDLPRCGMAADIATALMREVFDFIDAPIELVTAPHAPDPFNASLETSYRPDAAKVVDAVRRTLALASR